MRRHQLLPAIAAAAAGLTLTGPAGAFAQPAKAAAGARPPSALERLEKSWVEPDTSTPSGTMYRTFRSRTIGADVSYLVYLSPGYEEAGEQRYPVLYWLHGTGGTQTRGAEVVKRADAAIRVDRVPPMLVVLVNGLRGATMYCDSRDGKWLLETVIVRDLVPHIDQTYRTLARREARAVEGFSMGGFGAAHLGFKFPELFGVVSILAPALLGPDLNIRWEEHFSHVFNNDLVAFEAENPFRLAARNADRLRGRSLIRLVPHDEPGKWLIARCDQLHAVLTENGIAHEYDPRRDVMWKMTPEQDRAYIRYGMARMGAYANLMPVLGNEIELKTTNYKEKAFDLSCNTWINEMGAFLKSRTVFRQPVTVHNPCWHEIAVNPSYFTLLKDWPFAGWTDCMLKQAQVGCIGAASAMSDSVPQPQKVVYNERSYARHNQVLIDLRKFNQPVINEEPAYDMGSKSAYASQTPETMRPTFWTAATAGAYTMWGSKSTYVTGDPVPQMTGSPTLRCMRVHHDVMAGLPFWEMSPMNEVVTAANVAIDGEEWRTNFASAKPGEVYLIYSLHGGTGAVTLAPGQYTAERIDPHDGSREGLGAVQGGSVEFVLPAGDWVLLYRRTAAQ